MHCLLTFQLRNTKTADNKSTLLHYIAELIHERAPEIFRLREELQSAADASKSASREYS